MNAPDTATLTISTSSKTCTRVRGNGISFWDDPACQSLKSDLLAELHDKLPEGRAEPLEKVAQV